MNEFLMNTYPPAPVTFVRGEGPYLWDDEGRRYLDFLSGLAVTSLGHSHPAVTAAVAAQAGTLNHVSNLFANPLADEAAQTLDELLGGGGRVFFCNSGAEANECAIKLARKHGAGKRHVVISAHNSFHGRTLATLHATGQRKKHAGFEPLPEGFRHVPYEDLSTLEQELALGDVAAVLLETVQGEGGVYAGSASYFQGVQQLCREHDALLMIDEVQTGLGRTGTWFGFQQLGIEPDVVTMAKALGNGFPVGACWARAETANKFSPGDHATTFGGQPLALSAVQATLRVMQEIDAPQRAKDFGARLTEEASALPGVTGVRGRGLLLALELENGNARAVAQNALTAGLVVNAVTDSAIRLAPPLIIEDEHVDEAIGILARVTTV